MTAKLNAVTSPTEHLKPDPDSNKHQHLKLIVNSFDLLNKLLFKLEQTSWQPHKAIIAQ